MTKNDYRIEKAITDEDFERVWRFRYEAFRRVDAIEQNEDQLFRDKWEHAANVSSYLLYHDNAPAPIGTIRASVYSEDFGWMPTPGAETFSDVIREKLGPNTSYVESSRFAMAELEGRSLMRAHLYMFRALTMNAIEHRCDWVITAIHPKYLAYYQKTMGMKQLSDERDFSEYTFKHILIGSEFNQQTLEFSCKVNPHFTELLKEMAES